MQSLRRGFEIFRFMVSRIARTSTTALDLKRMLRLISKLIRGRQPSPQLNQAFTDLLQSNLRLRNVNWIVKVARQEQNFGVDSWSF